MAFITLMYSGLNQCGINEFMPAGLNRFKPGTGLNWPTLNGTTLPPPQIRWESLELGGNQDSKRYVHIEDGQLSLANRPGSARDHPGPYTYTVYQQPRTVVRGCDQWKLMPVAAVAFLETQTDSRIVGSLTWGKNESVR